MEAEAATTLARTRSALMAFAVIFNNVVSFLVFSFLDLLDLVLSHVYRVADYMIESEWKQCYGSSHRGTIVGSGGNIMVSGGGEPAKVIRVTSSRIQLEDVSDTLYSRPSLVVDVSQSTLRKLSKSGSTGGSHSVRQYYKRFEAVWTSGSGYQLNSNIVEKIKGRIVGMPHHFPRWSDCNCKCCTSWKSSSNASLFVRSEGAKGDTKEDVLFIHGFISSSTFWSETVYPNLSESAKSTHRFFAVDLLGFGKSPRPTDSLYTLREHVEMIEKSVLEANKVKSFHIVAHSLGCILALALAVRHPKAVKSLTLLAPPYFSVPKGEQATQYVMRKAAPRRVWPLIAFGASIASWYEHISRTICLLICKNHRLWEFLHKLLNITWYMP